MQLLFKIRIHFQDLKIAKVTLIFGKVLHGDKEYRSPISLISVPMKIVEKNY